MPGLAGLADCQDFPHHLRPFLSASLVVTNGGETIAYHKFAGVPAHKIGTLAADSLMNRRGSAHNAIAAIRLEQRWSAPFDEHALSLAKLAYSCF